MYMPEEAPKMNWSVIIQVEVDGPSDEDPEYEATVIARDEISALHAARVALASENPSVNFARAYCWHIRRADGEGV